MIRRVAATGRPVLLAALLLLPSLLAAAARQEGPQQVGAQPIQAPPAPLNEQVLQLPGDPERPVTLEVTLFVPPGPGPHPLAVLNHGATSASAHHRGQRYRYTYAADYFLSRGYVVALPMQRGFADSGGDINQHGCALDQVGLENAQDLGAVIAALSRRPEIDPTRIVVSGQSFGGWNSLALATAPPPGIRGVIVFSPALRSSDCSDQDQAMIEGARQFGRADRLPTLWFYGENDSVMPVATWRAVLAAYRDAGGQAQLVPVGRIMQDSHQLLSFPESLPIWTPRVDAFLARIGLPSREIDPRYLPTPPPPPTHFAELDDVAAVPFLTAAARDSYRTFLTHDLPRVFAIAPTGGAAAAYGGFDPLARALGACAGAGLTCRPYAIDDDVVWKAADSVPLVARTVPQGALSVIDFAYAINPDCSSRGLATLTITRPPGHGTARIQSARGHPRFAAASPLAACDATAVPGVAITYRPAAGYTGIDTMAFAETDIDGRHRAFRLALTVR